MKINEFDYCFKPRKINELVWNIGIIYKDLGYCRINKTAITNIFNLHNLDFNANNYLLDIKSKVEVIYNQNIDSILTKCEQLNQKWQAYKGEYFKIIKDVFNVDIDNQAVTNVYCYLQMLPIDEADLHDNIIYLNCNKSVDEIFKSFIIMLTKLILINRWNETNRWEFNTEFSIKNKIWLFAELAIDAIFTNKQLQQLTNYPTYKYFYKLEIGGKNIMEQFREMYVKLPLDKFFTELYLFVYNNYQELSQFKNYLY